MSRQRTALPGSFVMCPCRNRGGTALRKIPVIGDGMCLSIDSRRIKMGVERYFRLGLGRSSSASDSSVNFNGKWKNRLNSEMELNVDTNGDILGKYRTGVGQPSPVEEFDLKGFVSGDLIVFCVNFGRYGSLTSWSGQHTQDENGNEVIYTLWHLAKNVPDEDEPDKLWASIWAGANEYRRT